MAIKRRYRCRYCGHDFPAWLPVAQAPNGAMLLHHLAAMHRDQVGQYLARMRTDDDHDQVVVEAYEEVEGEDDGV
jgi:cell wall assembly regulator SMI1